MWLKTEPSLRIKAFGAEYQSKRLSPKTEERSNEKAAPFSATFIVQTNDSSTASLKRIMSHCSGTKVAQMR